MQPIASSFTFLGIILYWYGLYLMLGTLFGLAVFLMAAKQRALYDRALVAAAWMLPLALIVSRLLYCLTDSNFGAIASFRNVFRLTTGGLSMFGAIFGMVLALRIAAPKQKEAFGKLLDCFAPALMWFIFFERLGERFTALGISRPLVTGLLDNTFLAFRDTYDVYLKTWLLEAAAALILFVVLYRALRAAHRDGDVFLLGMLLFGTTQILFESLRYDSHMRFSFTGLQQVLSAVVYGVAIILLSLKAKKARPDSKLPILAPALLAVAIPGALGIEFLIDRSSINKALLYALYALLLAAPARLALTQYKRSMFHG